MVFFSEGKPRHPFGHLGRGAGGNFAESAIALSWALDRPLSQMKPDLHIRPAREADAAALLDIYRPYVESTAISFELVVPTVPEFADRIVKVLSGWAWLVAEMNSRCVGYAYASAHRERPAYRWSVETTAYVHSDFHRKGIGRALYLNLLSALSELGFCNAFAGVSLPNEKSLALHASVGFEPIGVFRSVGRKFGVWHDVAWFQRALRLAAPPSDGS